MIHPLLACLVLSTLSGSLAAEDELAEILREPDLLERHRRLEELVHRRPEDAWPRIHLAYILRRMDRLGEAERHLVEAARIDPQNFDAAYQLVLVILTAREFDAAESALIRARKLAMAATEDPSLPEDRRAWATELLKRMRADEDLIENELERRSAVDVHLRRIRFGLVGSGMLVAIGLSILGLRTLRSKRAARSEDRCALP